MPRFHFDVVEDGVAERDEVGLDLLSAEAARLEAARTAVEMMKDRTIRNAEPAGVSIIVRDSGPAPVCTVTVALKVD